MKKHFLLGLVLLILSSFASKAQEEISLYEAEVYQYAKYYPLRQTGLTFLPSGNQFVYQETKDTQQVYMLGNTSNGNSKSWFSLTDFNQWNPNEEASKRFPRFNWISDHEAVFTEDGQTYSKLNVKKKEVEQIVDVPEKAEHVNFNHDYSAFSYVQEHNLFVQVIGEKQHQLTRDGGNGIVYGQSVSRQEFGIHEGVFWSGDGTKLAFYRKDESQVSEYPLVHIDEVPATAEMVRYPMAGTESEKISLGVFDLKSKKINFISPKGEKDQYLTAISWVNNNEAISIGVLNRDQNHLQLGVYDPSNGSLIKEVIDLKRETYVEPEHGFWTLDENRSLWLAEVDAWQHVHLYNKDQAALLPLTSGRFEVHEIHAYNKASNELIITGTGEEVISGKYTDFSKNGTQRYTYVLNLKTLKKRILDDREGTHNAVVSEDGRFIIEHFSSIETPLETTLYSIDGKKIKTLYKADNPHADIKVGKPELIEFRSGQGQLLYGRVVKPSGFDPNKKYPVLLYVYGGPHAQLVRNTFNGAASLWMNWFAEQGYIVATVDNRGSANRGLEFEQETFRNLGEVEMQDQMEFVHFLKNQTWTDNERFAVHGWSFGGFMTINLLQNYPGEFVCGVAGGPVCDWSLYEVMYTERYMDTPETNREGFEKANLINNVSKIKDDLLVIHGTVDDVVLWQHSQQLVKSAVEAGVQLDYFIYPEHPHNVRGKDRAHLMTKVLNYVEEHLGE